MSTTVERQPSSDAGGHLSVYDRLTEIAGDARSELEQLDADAATQTERQRTEIEALRERQRKEIEALKERQREALAEITAKQRRLRGLLRTLGEDAPPASPPSQGSRRTRPRVSRTNQLALANLLRWLVKQPDEARFTVIGVSEIIGHHSADMYPLFRVLRDNELVIAKAGREDNGFKSRDLFKIRDRERGQQMLTELIGEPTAARPFAKLAKQQGQRRKPLVSSGNVVRYARAIKELVEAGQAEVDIYMIANHLGVSSSSSTGHAALKELTETRGIVSRGKRPGHGPRLWYSITDQAALNNLLEASPNGSK